MDKIKPLFTATASVIGGRNGRAESIGPRDGGGFGIQVKMRVEDRSIPKAELTFEVVGS